MKKKIISTILFAVLANALPTASAEYKEIWCGNSIYVVRPNGIIRQESPRVFQQIWRYIAANEGGSKRLHLGEITKALYNSKYPIVLTAIAKAESAFMPEATSKKGAIGVFQIHSSSGYRGTRIVSVDARTAERILEERGNLQSSRKRSLKLAVTRYCGRGPEAVSYQAKVFKIMKEVKRT
jgi:hypothetical protein